MPQMNGWMKASQRESTLLGRALPGRSGRGHNEEIAYSGGGVTCIRRNDSPVVTPKATFVPPPRKVTKPAPVAEQVKVISPPPTVVVPVADDPVALRAARLMLLGVLTARRDELELEAQAKAEREAEEARKDAERRRDEEIAEAYRQHQQQMLRERREEVAARIEGLDHEVVREIYWAGTDGYNRQTLASYARCTDMSTLDRMVESIENADRIVAKRRTEQARMAKERDERRSEVVKLFESERDERVFAETWFMSRSTAIDYVRRAPTLERVETFLGDYERGRRQLAKRLADEEAARRPPPPSPAQRQADEAKRQAALAAKKAETNPAPPPAPKPTYGYVPPPPPSRDSLPLMQRIAELSDAAIAAGYQSAKGWRYADKAQLVNAAKNPAGVKPVTAFVAHCEKVAREPKQATAAK